MKKRDIFLIMSSLCFGLFPVLGDVTPNVIVVLTDDQGYGDLSVHGNPILETPHLDRLYGESIRFSDFHVAPTCTPTRGELMTGIQSIRNKAMMVPAGRNLMRRDVVTMPEVFAENGYATGLFGKWHLGDAYPHRPMDRGFQKVVWHKGWGFESTLEYDNDYYYPRYYDGVEVKYSERFCTDLWFDEAMEWMDEQARSGQPFFTYLALNTPHRPLHPPAKDYFKYKDKVENPDLARFYGLITNIDENCGRLEQWLTDRKLKDNTILVYMNDNGSIAPSIVEDAYNAGMRGRKGLPYEGGHRAICFIRWPDGGLGKPRTIDALTSVTDILPTFVDLLGMRMPKTSLEFDGLSLALLLRNPNHKQGSRKIIVYDGHRETPLKDFKACLMWDNWRLVRGELYDIDADPGQERDVSKQYPGIFKEMQEFYDAYWNSNVESLEFVESIVVGSEHEPVTVLTPNEWVGVDHDSRHHFVGRVSEGSYWQIEAERSGVYRVELARWPFYMNRPLTAEGPSATIAGRPIDIAPGLPVAAVALSVDDAEPVIKSVSDGEEAVSIAFEIELSAGRHALQGWFLDHVKSELSGAFYARLERL